MIHSVKTARTFITEENIVNLRKNIASFDWARERAEEIIREADAFLAWGVDRLIPNLTPQELPRSFDVSQEHGCPSCGMEMMRYGNNGWLIDWKKHPWKVKCPNCGKLYPSNDFGKFYESGLDEHGLFSYDRADRSLLVNELYPELGPDYAVDDGHGWLRYPEDPQTGRYTFIPYYAYYAAWGGTGKRDSGYGFYAMRILSEAYLITDDRKYGYAAGALYCRFATFYPTLDVSVYPWKDGYKQAHGHTGLGRLGGTIWDTLMMVRAVEWYEMLFPCLDDGFAAYLAENPVRWLGEAPKTGAEIRDMIENNIHLMQYPDYRSYILNCNPGAAHNLLLKTAKILDRDDLFDEYAEFLFKHIEDIRVRWDRADMESLLLWKVDRDGFVGEISPGYNAMWSTNFIGMAELLKGHRYDLFNHPHFRKMGYMVANYMTADRYTLSLADHGVAGRPGFSSDINSQIKYFLATRRVKDAQLLVAAAGDGPLCTDWYMDCAAVDRLIRETAAQAGPFCSESRVFPGFGLAMIESHPDGKDPESNGVYFGSNWGHGHRDTLNLTVYGFGLDLMPDFGNPNFKDPNPERYRWTSNMASHNTVTIRQDAPYLDNEDVCFRRNCAVIRGGKIHHYLTDGKVSLIDAEAPHLYGVPYGRTAVTVDLDGKSRYIVDLFTAGGEEQHLSWHAAGVDTAADGAVFTAQGDGTYAGADIPYADMNYNRQYCDGFNYLTEVRRATVDGVCSVDWKCFDNWHVWDGDRDVHVKIHLLAGADEAALCTGQPPQAHPGNPRAFTYLMAKHTGGAARFVSLVEPYEDASFIRECTYDIVDGVETVTVTHMDGRVDTITVDRRDGKPFLQVTSTSGYAMTYGETVLTGEVVDFTKELRNDQSVTVRLDGDVNAETLVGRFIDIETDVEPNAFYEITSAEALGDGLWKLGTGDCTFITGFVDREHKEKGYTFCIAAGAAARLTL